MPRKHIVAMLIFVVFYCTITVLGQSSSQQCQALAALAQENPSCLMTWAWDDLPLPDPPVGFVCCNPDGVPFNETCAAPMPSCTKPISSYWECPMCPRPPARSYAGGKPINLATGNTYITEVDLSVPGLGGGLRLVRTWNSILPAVQMAYPPLFGTNWRSNYEERLVYNSPDLFLKFADGGGSVSSFAASSVGVQNVYSAAVPQTDKTTITDGSPNWTVQYENGEKHLFDATSGYLVAIVDRNGNTTQLSYDSSSRLITVTDAAARHLYFNYTGTSTLVSSMTSDMGITLSYAYDSLGRLIQVTKPDNSTINFAFDNASRITTVTDSNGKVLESHTYDPSGRGLTSSGANGVGAITVTYSQ
jgi:YD repeat-containing protein